MDQTLLFPTTYEMPERPLRPGSWLAFALGAAGLAVCITAMWFGMREVMAVGGACADGGPYVSAVPCPDGVTWLVAPSMPLGFAFGAIVAAAGGRIAGGASALAFLAWHALFLSLGWNFLEYGLDPAGPVDGPDAGLLTCAVLFALMGGLPLAFVPGMVRRLERRGWVLSLFLVAAAGGVVAGRALAAGVTGG